MPLTSRTTSKIIDIHKTMSAIISYPAERHVLKLRSRNYARSPLTVVHCFLFKKIILGNHCKTILYTSDHILYVCIARVCFEAFLFYTIAFVSQPWKDSWTTRPPVPQSSSTSCWGGETSLSGFYKTQQSSSTSSSSSVQRPSPSV